MARKIINEKRFKIIGLTPDECFAIGFGFNDTVNPQLMCDNCNKLINTDKEVYYIPVLNRVFCKKCLTDWYCTAKYYPEDSRYEALKYDTISNYIKEFDGEINIISL